MAGARSIFSVRWLFLLGIFMLFGNAWGEVPPPGPESSFVRLPKTDLDKEFCAEWDPDFSFKGSRCCGKRSWRHRRRGIKCPPQRSKRSFCDEMTAEQREYRRNHERGRLGDVLGLIEWEAQFSGTQSHCEPNNGFLSRGRPVLPSEINGLKLRRPGRCVNFGTDETVAMIEWLGREVRKKYPSAEFPHTHLLVGDISAPRGGCLGGRGGRRGHASHRNGRDVDLGFLFAGERVKSPDQYTRRFPRKENWWLLKKIFENPYACVKKVFLDWRHISKLKRTAKGDPAWDRIGPHLQHVRRHRNHYHVRLGEKPGAPGCLEPERILAETELDRSPAPRARAKR